MAGVTEYVTICDMPTQIMKRGNVLPDNGVLFLVIPGNPGIIEYYDKFMLHLHELSGQPVWGVSHAGHVTIPSVRDDLDILRKSYDVCSFAGQIRHKIEFVRSCIPPTVKLILIGHSVGCYIILKMLDELTTHNIAGFRRKRSTQDQVTRLTQDIEDAYDANLKAGAVFVDLTAAYDTVWHSGLALKLLHTIPSKHIVHFIMEMISNRSFVLSAGDSHSRKRRLRNGLPQGSVLAPTLFNI